MFVDGDKYYLINFLCKYYLNVLTVNCGVLRVLNVIGVLRACVKCVTVQQRFVLIVVCYTCPKCGI